jgi:hypothetical protein
MKYHFCLFLLLAFAVQGFTQNTSGFVGANDCYHKTFSIQVYIVEDKLGQLNTTPTDIQNAVSELNTYFDDICVQFAICDIDTIPNADHDTILMNEDAEQITSLYHRENTINLYVVQNVVGGNGGETNLGTVASMPTSNQRDAIFLNKTRVADRQTLARLMGKFFGLLYTYENNNELVDGSNCLTAGDGLCDTPADRAVVTSLITDANGDYFSPDWGNLMRFTSVGDEYHFTPEQYNVMLQVMKSGRNYLW